jgi:uncharacterized protein YggE
VATQKILNSRYALKDEIFAHFAEQLLKLYDKGHVMRIRILIGFMLMFLLSSCGPQTYNYSTINTKLPQLAVQADATVKVTPDLLQMRLGVVTKAKDAGQALAENNQQMSTVMLQLEQLGIVRDEMATGQFQIRPEWSLPPRPTPATWQRQIVGYQVNNELLIATTKVELAGKLLGLAQQAGANQIGGLRFSLANPELHRQQAITQATRKAIRKAQTLAAATGTRLGEIMSLTLDSPDRIMGSKLMMAETRTATADTVPVVAGKVEVYAGVTIVYNLVDISSKAK